MPSPRPSPRDTECAADSHYHWHATGIPDDFPLNKAFLDGIGFTAVEITAVEMYGKLQRVHWIIRQSWHNKIHNTFGPQKESILISTSFSTKLLLDQFDAPFAVHWYERLTGTCKAYRIGLVPFDAIQFTRRHKGLCTPGLGTDWYTNMANALCMVMSICLESADSCLKALVYSIEAKSCNGYAIVWKLLCHFAPASTRPK
jgi:hypothetical protein